MFETAAERVKFLKTGLSGKEIERLYIEQNKFKIICTPILYEGNEFDFVRSVLDNNRKTISKPVLGYVILIIALLFPISTLFIAFILLLFIPPIFAFAIILNEGISIISNELKRQTWPVKKPVVISILEAQKTVNF